MPVVLGVLAVVVRIYLKASKYEVLIKGLAKAIYPVVKAVADKTQNKIDDQLAMFLGLLNDDLAAQGHPPVDEARAKELFAELKGAP